MFTIKHFVGRPGLDAVESDWRTLLTRLPRRRHFHRPEWYRAYLDGYASDNGELSFFAAYDVNSLVAVIPLLHKHDRLFGLPVRSYSLVAGDYIELADICCDPQVSIDQVLVSLTTFLSADPTLDWDTIQFRHVLEESPLLRSDCSMFWRSTLRPHRGCDYLVLDQPYEAYLGSLSKNFRSNLKKANNKLREAGGGSYEWTHDPARLPEFFEKFLDVEASGWKGASGTAIRLNPSMNRFYRALIDYFGPDGHCEIQLYKLADTVIAGQFQLISDDTLYQFKIGYSEDHSRFAPGHVLNEAVLKHYCPNDQGIRFANLVSDAPWHRDWRPQRLQVSNLFAFNHTKMGMLAYAYKRSRHLLSRLRRRTS